MKPGDIMSVKGLAGRWKILTIQEGERPMRAFVRKVDETSDLTQPQKSVLIADLRADPDLEDFPVAAV